MKYNYRIVLLISVFLFLSGATGYGQDRGHSYVQYWQYQQCSDRHADINKEFVCREKVNGWSYDELSTIWEHAPGAKASIHHERECTKAECCGSEKCCNQGCCEKGCIHKECSRKSCARKDCSSKSEIRESKGCRDAGPTGMRAANGCRENQCREHASTCVSKSQCREQEASCSGKPQCREHASACVTKSQCREQEASCSGKSQCREHASCDAESQGECRSGMRHAEIYESNCKMIQNLNKSCCIPRYYADNLMKRNEQCKRGCEHHTCNGSCATYRQNAGNLETLQGELQEMCRIHSGKSCK